MSNTYIPTEDVLIGGEAVCHHDPSRFDLVSLDYGHSDVIACLVCPCGKRFYEVFTYAYTK